MKTNNELRELSLDKVNHELRELSLDEINTVSGGLGITGDVILDLGNGLNIPLNFDL